MPLSIPAENYITSQGGHAVPAPGQAFPVAEWRLQKRARLADSTTSASGGEARANVLRGGSFTINVPWNYTFLPETVGFREGNTLLALSLMLGSSGLQYGPFVAIMENVEVVVNAANDIVRLTVSGYSQGAVPDPTPVPP